MAGDLLVGEGGEEGESLEEPGEKEGVRRSATERELEKIKRNAFYRCPNPTDRGFSEKSSPTRAGTRPVRFARRRLPHRATTDACQTIVHDRIEHRWTKNDRDDPEERPRRSEGGAPDRRLACRLWIDSDKLDRRARPLRATRTRTAGGEHRRGWTLSQSAPVAQPSAVLVVKTGRLRRASGATTGKDESGDRVDQSVLTCCRGAATPSWSWCWRPCRWRPRGPC